MQVLLHVGRDPAGRRRLVEIGVLVRGADGEVSTRTAWHAERGDGEGLPLLRRLLDDRGAG